MWLRLMQSSENPEWSALPWHLADWRHRRRGWTTVPRQMARPRIATDLRYRSTNRHLSYRHHSLRQAQVWSRLMESVCQNCLLRSFNVVPCVASGAANGVTGDVCLWWRPELGYHLRGRANATHTNVTLLYNVGCLLLLVAGMTGKIL